MYSLLNHSVGNPGPHARQFKHIATTPLLPHIPRYHLPLGCKSLHRTYFQQMVNSSIYLLLCVFIAKIVRRFVMLFKKI